MNGEPLVEEKKSEVSARYRAMADLIDRNGEYPHGGSCVIVPPPGGGEPIDFVLLDASSHPAQFWSTIQTKIQLILEQMKNQPSHGFAVRR